MITTIKQYFIDSVTELGKVTWPTKKRAINVCILVVTFVIISAAVIAGLDFAFNKGYDYLLQLGERIAPSSPAVEITPEATPVPPVAPAPAAPQP